MISVRNEPVYPVIEEIFVIDVRQAPQTRAFWIGHYLRSCCNGALLFRWDSVAVA